MARTVKIKGFVFSLDALFAVIVAVTAVTTLASVMGMSKSQSYGHMPLSRAAEDALTLLDKQGYFHMVFNQSDTDVQANLDNLFPYYIPPQMGASINISLCSYNDPGFTCNRNFYKSVGGAMGDRTSSARRVFADPSNNQFGLAQIRVWYS